MWRKILPCAPWWLSGLGVSCGAAGRAVTQTGFEPDAIVALMTLVATVPLWIVVWSYWASFVIRRLWPLPVLAIEIGIAAAALQEMGRLPAGWF